MGSYRTAHHRQSRSITGPIWSCAAVWGLPVSCCPRPPRMDLESVQRSAGQALLRPRYHDADERENGRHHRRSDRFAGTSCVVAKTRPSRPKCCQSWRPDKAFNIEQATFNDYMAKLGEVSIPTSAAADLQAALKTSGSLRRAPVKSPTMRWMWCCLLKPAMKRNSIASRAVWPVPSCANMKWRSLKQLCWSSWSRIRSPWLGPTVSR